MKNEIYEVTYNDQGERICIIDNKEVKVKSMRNGLCALENGQTLNIFFKNDDIMKVSTNSDIGETLINLNSKGVLFSRTCPAKGRKDGQSKYKKVVVSEKNYISGYTKPSFEADKNYTYEEVYVNENEEGEANLKTTFNNRPSRAEHLINESGGKKVNAKGVYAKYKDNGYVSYVDESTQTLNTDDNTISQSVDSENNSPQKGNEEIKKQDVKKKLKKALLIIPIPIIIALSSQKDLINCKGDKISDKFMTKNPEIEYEDDKKNSDQTTALEDPTTLIDDSDINIIFDILGNDNINPEIMTISESCYENCEEIFNDISKYIAGDKDDLVKLYLGDEYVGTSNSDGIPSSFNQKLNDKYYSFSDEEIKIIEDVQNIHNISKLDENTIKPILTSYDIQFNDQDLNDTDKLNSYKLEIIKKETNYDLTDIEDLKNVQTIFTQYFTKQSELREKNIDLTKKHEKTTEESIQNRPSEGKKSYEKEKLIHKYKVDEQEAKLKEDIEAKKLISEIGNILQIKADLIQTNAKYYDDLIQENLDKEKNNDERIENLAQEALNRYNQDEFEL